MLYIGLDPSLTGTGIVCLDESGKIKDQKLIKTLSNDLIEDRLILIIDSIMEFIEKCAVRTTDGYDHVLNIMMEGLSFGAKGNAVMQMAGLHYCIRIFLKKESTYEYSFINSYHVAPPTTLKKFVTGKGNSKKELILLEVYKRWGIEFKNNNLADAFVLAKMAYEENKNDKIFD